METVGGIYFQLLQLFNRFIRYNPPLCIEPRSDGLNVAYVQSIKITGCTGLLFYFLDWARPRKASHDCLVPFYHLPARLGKRVGGGIAGARLRSD